MKQINFLVAVGIILATFSDANAQVGPVPVGYAIAKYNPSTGEIVVSINGVNNWFIESASNSLTGDAPIFGTIPGALPSDSDSLIGETAFAVATATDHSLGNVAAVGLSEFNDMKIYWNAGLGAPLQMRGVNGPLTPEPIAGINGPFFIDLASDPLNITLITDSYSGNVDTSFSWDADGIPGFEANTGSVRTYEIPDVVAAFGGVGVYNVGVSVSDIGGNDTAYTTVTIINSIPEPTSLALVGLGLAFAASSRRQSQQSKQYWK